ncbi:uncharacterized protein DS421_13g418680 [Arachis hypogaea]|nr:uncharacterized protein DS421_13g418680 [Arachis hypogaea]
MHEGNKMVEKRHGDGEGEALWWVVLEIDGEARGRVEKEEVPSCACTRQCVVRTH